MSLELITAPWTASPLGNEPLTLAEAKNYLKVETGEITDDDLIYDLIEVARNWCETFTARTLINQTWKYYLDAFPEADANWNPNAEIRLPLGQAQTLVAFKYYDEDGVEQDMVGDSPQLYQQSFTNTAGGILIPAYDYSWPAIKSVINPIHVEWTVGYGATASAIPKQLKMACLWKVADLYDSRGDQDLPVFVRSQHAKGAVAEALARPYQLERV